MRKRINRLFQGSICDIIAQKVVMSNYIEALSESQQIEVRNIALRKSMFFSDWSDAFEIYLSLLITDRDDFNMMKFLKDTTFNSVKEVINKISMMYNEPPSRKFVLKNSGEIDKNAESIYKNIDVDRLGKRVNKMYNLLNDVIVLVDWNQVTKKIFFRLLDRSNCDVTMHRYYPGMIEKLTIYVDTDIDSNVVDQFEDRNNYISGIYKIVWTQKEHYILNDKNEKVQIPGRDKGDFINPYGIIPIVDLHKEPIEGLFWNPISNNELMELMFHICFEKTCDNYDNLFNSFKQIWLVGEPNMVDRISDNVKRSPGSINKFPTVGSSGSVVTVDTQGDLKGRQEVRDANKKTVYDIFGASVEFSQTGARQSGEALKVRNVALQNVRQEQIVDFNVYEIDMFKIVRVVNNYWNEAEKIDDNTNIEIAFPESQVFTDRESKLKYYWELFTKGLISGASFYQVFNPTTTDAKEADKLIKENIQYYNNLFGEPNFIENNIKNIADVEE